MGRCEQQNVGTFLKKLHDQGKVITKILIYTLGRKEPKARISCSYCGKDNHLVKDCFKKNPFSTPKFVAAVNTSFAASNSRKKQKVDKPRSPIMTPAVPQPTGGCAGVYGGSSLNCSVCNQSNHTFTGKDGTPMQSYRLYSCPVFWIWLLL